MATLRDIRRRVTSVGNTRQITSAMKMVSTAKLARAQNAARAAQPYAEVLRSMVTSIAGGLSGEDHPLLQTREGGKSVVVLFTSDRGLCGGFNTALNKTLLARLVGGGDMPEPELVIFGRTGNDFFRRRRFTISKAVLNAREAERRDEIRAVIESLSARFTAGEIGRVVLAFNRYHNPISQEPTLLPLLPVAPPAQSGAEAEPGDQRETIFEPSLAAVLDSLLPRYLESQLLQALLSTEAGEHGARMVAMDGATRNAGEMIKRLTLEMNKARQASITKELIEIVNGAQAL